MGGLNPGQLSFYANQGYLVVADLFPPEALGPVIDDLSREIDLAARRTYSEGRLRQLFEQEPFERRLLRICEAVEDPSDILSTVRGKRRSQGMFEVITHPAILDIVESVIGPEILAHPQFNVRAKLPGQDTTVVPWHQDLAYLQPDAEGTFMVNFWIPLVDATSENGGMEVIPGSHKTGLIAHEGDMGPAGNFHGIPDERLPEGTPVACPIRKGGLLVIQHKTAHRSLPNTSDHIRWSLDLRYSDPSFPTGRDGVPGFIARSRRHPDAVAKSHLDWLALFDSKAG